MEDYCKYQQRLMEVLPERPDNHSSFLQGINNLFSLIGLRSFWQSTFYGLKMQVDQLRRHGQKIEALHLLLQGLSQNHFWLNHATKWWYLMHLSISLAQDLKLSAANQFSSPIQRLFKLSMQAPTPWQGYNVAYSFVSLSLWSFELGKTQKAIEQINCAIHADSSWGYPEYLLGWYGLSLEGIDPVAHFVKAVKLNWSLLEKLKQDPLGQRFPYILQAVKEKVLEKSDKI